jgi:hypothetical protein
MVTGSLLIASVSKRSTVGRQMSLAVRCLGVDLAAFVLKTFLFRFERSTEAV